MQSQSITESMDSTNFLQKLLDVAVEPMVVLDTDLRVFSANREFYHTFKLTASETEGRFFGELGNNQWNAPIIREYLDSTVSGNIGFNDLEVTLTFPEIGEKAMRINGRRVEQEKEKDLILLAIEDLSRHMHASLELEKIEAEYRELVEEINSIIIRLDNEGKITYFNRFSEQLFGYQRSEVIGQPYVGTLLPETYAEGRDNSGLIDDIKTHPDKYYINESVGFNRSGNEVWFSWSARVLRDKEGNAEEILIDGNDITSEREQRIMAREANALVQSSPDLMARLDAKRRYTFVNPRYAQSAGLSVDQLIGKVAGRMKLSSEGLRPIKEVMDTIEKDRQGKTLEVKLQNRWYSTNVAPELDEKQNVKSFMIFSHDITELKETEEALMRERERLSQSEKRFRTVLENSLDATYQRDLVKDVYDYISPAVEHITGYSAEEFGSMDMETILERIHPDHVPEVIRDLEAILDSDQSSGLLEYAFKGKSGDYRWLADNFRVIRDDNGQPLYRIGVIRDITGRKEMEEMMLSSLDTAEKRAREAEEERRIIEAVIDNVPEGFLLVDAETEKILMVSRHLAEFAGIHRKDFMNISLDQYAGRLNITKLDGNELALEEMPILRSMKKGEVVVSEHYRLTNRHGDAVTVLINSAPVRDANGKIIRGIAAWRNIEPLKQAEDQLRRSRDAARAAMNKAEERQRILETILVSIPEGITVIEAPDGTLQLVSRYYENFIGVSKEDLYGTRLANRMEKYSEMGVSSEMPMPLEQNPSWRALKKGEVVMNEEWTVVQSDGSRSVVSVIASPVRDEQGEITHAVTSFRDITQSKEMEATLRRTEFEFRTLVENSPDLILRLDRQMRYQFVNSAYERMTGLSRDRFLGKTNRDLGMPDEYSEPWEEGVRKAIHSGREINTEFSFWSLFGQRHFWGRIIPEFEPDGRVQSVMMVARDITERKQAEEHIRYVSFHDSVTGLYNRAYFEEEIKRLDTERSLPVSFIIGDLNNLKLVNDTFGHNEGDRLLLKIAEILRATCRDADIIARWGGDEFAVILPGTRAATADRICSRIKKEVSSSQGTIIVPSIALGVAEKNVAEDNIHRVIREAEEHMYENKLAESRKNQEVVLASLLHRVRDKWPELDHHVERTYDLGRMFGNKLGFSDSQMEDLFMLIRLHDIGKAVIPDYLLRKTEKLTNREWEMVKRHPEAGFRIAKTFGDTARISEAILTQRERWDGSGYPRGLKGKQIPFLSRVFSIIDTYDTITHDRPYERAFTRQEAVEELKHKSGKQFDPELSRAFISSVST